MRLITPVFATLLVIVFAMAACTSDDGAQPTSTTTSTSSSTTTSTTEPTTTTSSTTSTTIDPVAEIEAEVEAAYLRSYEVFVECYRTLPDCDPNEVFPEVYAPPTLPRQVLAALETKAEDLTYGPPVDPATARTEVLGISVGDDLRTAVVSFCTLAADQEFEIGADGTTTLTDDNDSILVAWGDANMLLGDDDIWRVIDYPDEIGDVVEFPLSDLDARLEEGTLCGGELNT